MSTTAACPVCGAESIGYKYCLNCGQRLDNAAPPKPPSEPEQDAGSRNISTTEDTAEVPLLSEPAPQHPTPSEPVGSADTPSYAAPPGITAAGGLRGRFNRPSVAGLRSSATTKWNDAAIGGRSAPFMIGLLALFVVMLLLLAAGLVLMLSGDDDTTPSKPSRSASASAKDTTTATCWNDERVRRLSQCPPLTGVAAMSWVFGSLDRDLCRPAATPAGVRTAWKCRMRSTAGFSQVRYLEFDDVDSMRTWVRAETRRVPRTLIRAERADPERWIWRERRPGADDRWSTTSSYVGERWAVRVDSGTKKARNDAFAAVEFRPLRWLHGVPDDDRSAQ